MRTVTNFKTGLVAGSVRYHLQDKLAGHTTPGRGFRDSYKRSVRHARRVLARSLRAGILAD